ncbi:MAG: DUF4386 domain-containing protein [Specibacter sp.]
MSTQETRLGNFAPAPTIRSVRTASVVAGVGLAMMALLSAFAVFGALGGIGSAGDTSRVAQAITDSESLFRWGILALILVAVLDVIVAAGLLEVFAPVSRKVSTLAAYFRVAYAGVFLVAISQLPGMLADAGGSASVEQRVQTFDDLWHVGLVFFGVHLVLIGWLAYRSGWVATIFGVLLVVSGLGYLADTVGTVLVPGYSPVIAQFTFVGEVALIFWLLVKGRCLASLEGTTAAAKPPSTAR